MRLCAGPLRRARRASTACRSARSHASESGRRAGYRAGRRAAAKWRASRQHVRRAASTSRNRQAQVRPGGIQGTHRDARARLGANSHRQPDPALPGYRPESITTHAPEPSMARIMTIAKSYVVVDVSVVCFEASVGNAHSHATNACSVTLTL